MEQGKDVLVNAFGLVVFLGTLAFVGALAAMERFAKEDKRGVRVRGLGVPFSR